MDEERREDATRPVETGDSSDHRDLRTVALDLLDFHAVRQQVADRATFFPARQLALQLTPSYHVHEVEALQRETAEGRALLDEAGDVDLHTTADSSSSVTRAALGGLLTGLELLTVAESLEVQRRARSSISKAAPKIPLLAAIGEAIPDVSHLQRDISSLINLRGEVEDDATPALGALRSQVRQAYERVTEALNRLIQSSVGRETLQDQVISIRGDRFVVQVKAEMRQRVPGIVHDASNTGATLFIEPFATVELCNNWRELALEEEREVQRVLRELSSRVGELADDIRRGNELAARLDFILARARYSTSIGGVSAFSRGEDAPDETGTASLRLLNARHPLLGDSAVPITLIIGPGWSVLVITGPNTGGKTVAMKTVGLLALMHQSGLHISADDGSSLPVFDGVLADVGDQQSIEESVSTFSSHMRNVINILAEAGPTSLVLMDEIGASTDPDEGSALAKAILDHLASHNIPTIATTHHRTVAAYAETTSAMMNASVDLDPSTLKPTYQLTMGVPGRSYAMSVAADIGLPEQIMDKAQELLEPQHIRFEDWLNELQNERTQLQTTLQEAEEARARAEAIRRDLETQLEYLVTHREDILDSTRRELSDQYEDVRRKLRRAEAAASWREPPADVQRSKERLLEVKKEVAARMAAPRPAPQRADRVPISVGDPVHVRGLNLRGTVVSLSEPAGEAEVNVGKVRLRLGLTRLSREEPEPGTEEEPAQIRAALGPALSTPELDLRGLRAEEALVRLETFLDRAVRDGLSSVRIIHGKGTGALRSAVREHLERQPLARSFELEARERGGDGATVVELA